MATKVTINENGTVRVNGEVADYDNLLEVTNPVGEYKTSDGKTLVLFDYENGFIEYFLDTSFASGESANFTELTFDEIMEYYEIQ